MHEDKKPVVLDCTLRDGGYYNRWDFSNELITSIVGALVQSNVDIIELGYKSPPHSEFFGLTRYCNEELLGPLLPSGGNAEYAFMLDAKEFFEDGKASRSIVESVVRDASDSLFSWVRVATHPTTLGPAIDLVNMLKEKGYQVALNLMGISMLPIPDMRSRIASAPLDSVDVLYLADSYGSLTPAETVERLSVMRDSFAGKLGVHMHENQGLALSNTLAAIANGVDFVDATLTGMGRGSGNLRLEQLLLTLFFRFGRDDFHPSALLPVIREHMAAMQQHHGWGWDFSYMLSGLTGIHPTYCQELRSGARFDLEEIVQILEAIPQESRAKYREDALFEATASLRSNESAAADLVDNRDRYQASQSDEVLIVANGPSVGRHEPALRAFIDERKPLVIECNDVPALRGVERLTTVINNLRLRQVFSAEADPARTVVTGQARVPAFDAAPPKYVPYELKAHEFSPEGESLALPSYLVGTFAFGIATHSKPKRIYVAGFDGFEDSSSSEHRQMSEFWELALRYADAHGIEVRSILPTRYALEERSVYALCEPSR